MAYKLMIQGTMSSAGKSFIVTALCRIFSDLGYRVAPFKSQNMALNSGVTFDGYEMGRAQIVQAEAARTTPDVRMNPVLLKPNSDVGSQVIVMGKPIGNMKASEYYEYKKTLIPVIQEAFYSLEKDYDVIIVEGAGSPAEINLKENDIVNMGIAKLFDIPVLLTGDIDLGGVFAQLLGTLEWLDEKEKSLIKGLIINKFRGDKNLLLPGIEMLEQRVGKKVVGVIPYTKADIDEEDSVTRKLETKIPQNDSDGGNDSEILIYVIRLTHLSNFTDFTPLSQIEGTKVEYISTIPETNPDLLIIPGTKSTIYDLNWMRENGFIDYVKYLSEKTPIIGVCGGYQMLGMEIEDPDETEGEAKSAEGIGLLNTKTVMGQEKTLKKVAGKLAGCEGFFDCLNGKEYEGYEIHSGQTDEYMGKTTENSKEQLDVISQNDLKKKSEKPDYEICYKKSDKQESNNVFGTYIHGIFDKASVSKALINGLRRRKNLADLAIEPLDYMNIKDREYDLAAKEVRQALDMNYLSEIMGISNE